MADHDDLRNPQPHAAPTKTLTDKVIELALSLGGGAVTLVSGLLAAALIMYSGYVLYDTFATERAASSNAWDLLQYKPEILEDPEAALDPSALAAINSDYRAWLTVYETGIDYPVVQGPNDLYYASHDIYGNDSLTGAIYLAAGNSPDFTDDYNLIFGHHMDNGAMFGGLDDMTGSETGIVITSDTIYDVQFFAIVTTDAYERRIYDVGDRMDDVMDFLRSGGEGGVGVGTEVIYFDEEAAADAEKLVALSTCADARTMGRLVVIGKMTPRVITKEVTVTKVWDDNNDQDGIRPGTIAVTANDGTKAVLKAEENWTVTLTLPKYDNAGEITYTWTEDNVPAGYNLTGNVTEGDATTLTNTHSPETVDVTVRKVWDDDNDRDGLRPKEEIRVTLLADGVFLKEVTLKAGEDWTATEAGLPKYKNGGEAIAYTWTEENAQVPSGYALTGNETESGVTVLTNTHVPATVTLGVEKEWDDGSNQDGIRPEEIQVTLWADDAVERTVTLKAENVWTETISGLPKYRDGGVEIAYTWTEEEGQVPAGYELKETLTEPWPEGDFTVLVNRHLPETVDVAVQKVWDDNNDQDGIRPKAEIRVTLLSDGAVLRDVTLKADEDWAAVAEGLPKYKNGVEIVYTWTERNVPAGYELSGNTPVEQYRTILTNSHETDTTSVTVTKIWDDDGDRDGIRPKEEIRVSLMADGAFLREVTLKAEKGWTETVSGLPKNDNGTAIVYTWTETEDQLPAGYALTGNRTDKGTTVLTNTHVPETVTLGVEKAWDDDSDRDGIRPKDEIRVSLLADGVFLREVTLKAREGWKAQASGLNKYNNGVEIAYTWTETEEQLPAGYTLAGTAPGTEAGVTVITNAHTPAAAPLTVKKVWNDDGDRDGRRPDALTVILYADGEEAARLTLTGDKDWTASTEPLPVYAGGKAIEYTWEEVWDSRTEGYYELTGSSTKDGVTTLTNTHEPETVIVSVRKVWDDDNDRDRKRPASVTVRLYADGREIGSAALNKANDWSASFEEFRYSAGTPAVYTWTEDEGDYSAYYTLTGNEETTAYHTEITNTHEPEKVTLTVEKVWDDDNDRDGKRPGTLAVTLYADGKECLRTQLTAENGWKAEAELPANDKGQAIAYTWKEENVPGYTGASAVEGNAAIFTNTHAPKVTGLTVKKVWDDDGDRDGLRPEGLTVYLIADGQPVREITLNEENGWTFTADNLPVYDQGRAIRYSWREEVPEGYTRRMSSNNLTTTFTNVHSAAKRTLFVTKVWDDGEDQDGIRPESLTVTLLANGKAVGSVTLNAGNGWRGSILDLPVNDGGKAIAYTWDEETVEGYVLSGSVTTGAATVLTNTHETEQTVATVRKVWDDDSNRDGLRPGSIVMTLSDGTKVTLNEANNWTGTVENLPRYSGGKEIAYTWTEGPLPDGYEQTGYETVGTVTTVTNTHSIETTSATVKKVWNDDNNRDGIRPGSIVMTLSDGTKVTLDESNNWTATVEGLLKNKDGREIAYTWTEGAVEGYEQTGYNTVGTVTTVTNTHEPEKQTLSVTKVWDDGGDQDGIRPASLTVTLLADGKPTGSVTLDAGNGWMDSVSDLPVNAEGKAIAYTWDEGTVEGYTLSGSVTTGTSTVLTNTHETERTVATVTKVWDDDSNRDGLRPTSIVMTLSDGTKVTLNEANNWTGTVENLPRYSGGKEIAYTWTEDTVEGYEQTGYETVGTVTTVTNTHSIETTSATVKKVWDDDDNRDGIRPGSIVMTLSDGTKVTLDESNNWTASVEDLPKNKDGREIAYTWTEGAVEGYEQTGYNTVGTVTTVTNTHEPEKQTLSVTKVWDDGGNQDGIRPESLTVTLLADGKPAGSATLDAGNGWTNSVSDLPVNAGGKAIAYTWDEGTVEGYTLSGSVTTGTSTVLTNKHKTAVTIATVTKVWDDDSNRDGLRPRSIVMTLSDGTKVTLNEANNWTGTVENLPRYSGGKEIAYTWTEGPLPDGYEQTGYATVGTLTTVTNTHSIATTSVTVVKVWNDDDNRDGMRPDKLMVTLNGEHNVELNEENGWTATVEGLPVYISRGRTINYTWTEPSIPGYTSEAPVTVDSVTTFENVHVPETRPLTVQKVWDDDDDRDGKRPKEITVILKADGTEIGRYTLNDGNGWEYVTEPLPVSAEGEEIAYTWSEETIPAGYTLTVAPDPDAGITILTNTHKPATVTLTVKKEWKDSNSSSRPTSVTVYLIGGGQTLRYTLDKAHNWELKVEVPRYQDGKEIKYSWQELTVTGYTTKITAKGNVTTVTNTKKSGGGGGGTPKTYTLTIKYVYEDGTVAAKTYTATYKKGKTYSVTSPVIDGYTASEKVVKGTMPGNDVLVTVIYTGTAGPAPEPDTPLGFGVIYFNVGDCLE